MRIKTLLWCGFASICAVMIALWTIAMVQMQVAETHVDNIIRAGRNESLAKDIVAGVNSMRRYQLSALVAADDERDKELLRVTTTGQDNARLAEDLEKRQRNPETQQLAASLRVQNDRYTQGNEQVLALAKAGSVEAMKALVQGEARTIQRALVAEGEQFIKIQQARRSEAEQAAHDAEAFAFRLMLALLTIGVLLAVAISFLVTRRIARQLGGEPEDARQLVQRVATGDLTQEVALATGDSESLMAHQQKMQSRLRAVLQNVATAVDRTEAAAQTLSGSSQQVAAASGATSDSAAAMAAAVEQMSVSMSQVADNTREALDTARQAWQLSENGGHVIEQATSEINSIADTVRNTSATMSALDDSSSRISTVVQVIKEVADQTNLLALNAAIEAARAGESGRGFAVVADEVRKLAERTGKATSEINAMVMKIQQETRNSLSSMEGAVHQVDRGVELAGLAGDAIRQIRGSVDRVVAVVSGIGAGINEQSIASQLIAQRVENVAQSSEENNAAARQTADSARTLSGLATSLRNTVAQFRI
ncbi:MAG: methyl-accepting chemotaxis protein [Candidatus Accumulibacter sp. UW26]|jgi:methyl-accepting chemotaxis protein